MTRHSVSPFIALAAFLVLSVSAVAQNLVPDPGFENWNGTIGVNPNTLGGLLLWDEANGTPDHHHQLNPPGNNLTSLTPCPLGNGQTDCGTPYAGQAVLGVYKGNGAAGTKEWAAIALSSPMVPGQPYRVSYWIQNKYDRPQFIMETNQWGMFFGNSMVPPFNPNTYTFSTAPADWVTCSQVINDTIWHYLEWCYVPTQAYTHIYVGYVGDVINSTTNAWSGSGSVGFYAWVDEVVVEPITLSLTTSPDASICTGDSTLIWASSPLGVTWDGGLTTDSAIWVSPTSTTTYYVQTLGSGGCVVQDSVVVDVTNCNCTIILQNNVAGLDDTGCPGPGNCNGTAEATPTNGLAPYSYVWDDPLAQTTALATGLCAGTYSCIVQDANGCADTVSVTLNGPAFPVLTTVVTDESCQGLADGAIDLTVTGGTGPFFFLWSNGAGTEDLAGLVGGTYSVQVTDGIGCVHADTVVVANGPAPVQANINAAGPYCEDDQPVVLNAAPSGGTWSGTGVVPATGVFDPAIGPGTYMVYYMPAQSCSLIDSASIVVEAAPVASFSVAPTSGCGPLDVTLSPIGLQAGQQCDWQLGDGNSSSANSAFTHTYSLSGSFDVTLTVTSAAGCSDALTEADIVYVSPVPVAQFNVDFPGGPFIGQTVLFQDATPGTIVAWDWQFGDGEGAQGPAAEHTYLEQGFYDVTLMVVTDSGCVSVVTSTIEIVSETSVFMPNAFSPDGDGTNEVLRAELQGVSSDHFELLIMDRWGRSVFETNDPGVAWDGTFSNGGVEVPTGIYVWKLKARSAYSGDRIDRTGHVMLLR